MADQGYKKGVIDCTQIVDTSRVKGQSIIITGGAAGMGEQTVRAFVKAGAYVTFGDMNESSGNELEKEVGPNARFFHCDITSWESQLRMFRHAKANSPSKSIDVVVACAGINSSDPVYFGEDKEDEPAKPATRIIDVNVIGTIYTLKLARYYFLKNPEGGNRDRCFIIFSSVAGYADLPGGLIYTASKFALRGLMRCSRRSTALDGIRTNIIAPWYVDTKFMSPTVIEHARKQGVKFADAADAANAILKISSKTSINGRSFAIIPRDNDQAPFGYCDQDLDDFADGSFAEWQQEVLLSASHRLQPRPQVQ